jgi:microcystin-dependent protein
MPGNCSIYRSWNTNDELTAADLTTSFVTVGVTNMTTQCMDDYSVDVTQMQSTVDPYPGAVESKATSLAGEIERLRFQIKQITGEAQWYHDPQTTLAATAGAPTGAIVGFGGSSAPAGWLLCGGQAVNRTTFAALFAVISTTYGAGDGSTTFNVPDLRGRVPAGKDDMGGSAANRLTTGGSGINGAALASAGGTETHTLTEPQMRHQHSTTVSGTTGTASVTAAGGEGGATRTPDHTHSINASGTSGNPINLSVSAHQNTQPTLIVNYIIKT